MHLSTHFLIKSLCPMLFIVFSVGCTTTKRLRAKKPKYKKLEVYGGYHPQEVGLQFRKVHPALSACFSENGSPKGRLVFQFSIASESGAISSVTELQDVDSIKDTKFVACALKAVEGLKYDKLNAGNDTKVIFPVEFPLSN